MPEAQTAIDRLFHALGDSTRRTMLRILSLGPVPASQLAPPLKISLAAVVQHLHVLEECGLVRTEKVGRVRMCRMEPRGFNLLEAWIRDHRSACEKRLDKLGQFLDDN